MILSNRVSRISETETTVLLGFEVDLPMYDIKNISVYPAKVRCSSNKRLLYSRGMLYIKAAK